MENIFEFDDYKAFLTQFLNSDRSLRGTQSAMARHLQCQPASLYQILKNKADLTEEQALRMTSFLKFDVDQRDYFLNLVRLGKASSVDLRAFFSSELARLKRARLNLKNRVDANEPVSDEAFWEYYVSTPIPAKIHVLTSSKKFQTSKAIAQRLSIDEDVVLATLRRLLQKELVSFRNEKWSFMNRSIHFAKESKQNQRLQINRRVEALSAVIAASDSEAVHFSSHFTIDASSLEKLHRIIADFVKSSQKVIHAGGTDESYVLNIDLFRS